MRQQRRRVTQRGARREVRGQRAAHGLRPHPTLQPGRHGGGEAGRFPYGQQQAVVVAAQGGQERGGRGVPDRVGGPGCGKWGPRGLEGRVPGPGRPVRALPPWPVRRVPVGRAASRALPPQGARTTPYG
ncbi:hypothetical protein TPA0909_11980 [Streptomyces albus]|nr:hypothetical protein TPA0909_11980 [Streptomyces albus]